MLLSGELGGGGFESGRPREWMLDRASDLRRDGDRVSTVAWILDVDVVGGCGVPSESLLEHCCLRLAERRERGTHLSFGKDAREPPTK